MKTLRWIPLLLLTALSPLGSVGFSGSLLQAATNANIATNSNNLTVLGFVDATNNIYFGTTATNQSAVLLNYTDTNHTVGFIATQPSSAYLWQDTLLTNSVRNKMKLDGSNNLTLFTTNGSNGIILNPNTGGITLVGTGTGAGITLSDGTVISSAASLRSTGLYSSSSSVTPLLSFDASGNLRSSPNSLAMGQGVTASGQYASAFGVSNTASGGGAMAWGYSNTASGPYSTAFGNGASALGAMATAFGNGTASDSFSMAFGEQTYASGRAAIALGFDSRASGYYSTAFSGATVTGQHSIGGGAYAIASGNYALALGGWSPRALGENSVALGSAWAVGASSVALGGGWAGGTNSTCFGASTAARGTLSTCFGNWTTAWGFDSTAFGLGSYAAGDISTTFGNQVSANSYASVAFGQFNAGIAPSGGGATNWVATDPVLEIGNGVSGAGSNAVTIFKNGKLRTAGTIESQAGMRVPQTGDLSMGSYTNGNNPASLNPATGLLYPNGQ